MMLVPLFHYGNNPRKCVNYNLYLFLKLTIEFSNLTEIVNQQGTLRIVHRRVDPFIYYLIRILGMKAQSANIGNITFLPFDKNKYFPIYSPQTSKFVDHKYCYIYLIVCPANTSMVLLSTAAIVSIIRQLS